MEDNLLYADLLCIFLIIRIKKPTRLVEKYFDPFNLVFTFVGIREPPGDLPHS
jgi:hypothetical protein